MLAAEFVGLGVPKDYGEDYEGLRLVFEIRLHNPAQYVAYVLGIDGSVFTGSRQSPRMYYLGQARSLMLVQIPPKEYTATRIYLDLRHDDIEFIEKLRAGENPRFTVKLSTQFIACVPQQSLTPSQNYIPIGPCAQTLSSLAPQPQQLYLIRCYIPLMDPRSNGSIIETDRDTWLDVLSKLGFKHVRVIEVPAITGVANEHAKAAIEHLDRAWVLMSANYEEALNAARKALEELKSYAKDLGFVDVKGEIDFAKVYGASPDSDLVRGMDNIFRGLWALTNVGSHAGRSRLIKRADVEFVITTIYMLMKSMQENMKSQQP
ncbi:MAG: hypothetical protein AT710_08715 [Thermocladium sp. ECH_B]|nr:MAG: hypothetical protein AT710_08715 [Thermocladium sp. ECH_B]